MVRSAKRFGPQCLWLWVQEWGIVLGDVAQVVCPPGGHLCSFYPAIFWLLCPTLVVSSVLGGSSILIPFGYFSRLLPGTLGGSVVL